MNFKKFISGVSAFAIAASAFASMAVTASAAAVAYGDYTTRESIVDLWTIDGTGTAAELKQDTKSQWVQVHDGAYFELDTTKNYVITIKGKGYATDVSKCGFLQLQTAGGDALISAEKTNWDSTETVTITINNTDTTKPSTISQTGGASYEGTQFKETAAGAVVGRIAVRDSHSKVDEQYRIFTTLSIVNPDTATNMTYTETNGLKPIITVKDSNGDIVSNTATVDNGDYTYTAKLSGYQTVYGSFTAEGGTKEVPFTMSAKPSVINTTDVGTNSRVMDLYAEDGDKTFTSNQKVDISALNLAVGDQVVLEYDMFVPGDCSAYVTLSGNSNDPTGAGISFTAEEQTTAVKYDGGGRNTGTIATYATNTWAHVKESFTILADTSAEGIAANSTDKRTSDVTMEVTPVGGSKATGTCVGRNLASNFIFADREGNKTYKPYSFDRIRFYGTFSIANAKIYVVDPEATPHAEAFTFEKTAAELGENAQVKVVFQNDSTKVTRDYSEALGTTFSGLGSANIAVVITGIADGYSVKSVTIE